MSHFPEDVLLEILPKLPVESLVRFRSMSTYYRTLFATQSFVSLHSRHSKNNIIVHNLSTNRFNSISHGPLTLIDSCNGLVCLTSSPSQNRLNIHVCNLATRESVLVHGNGGRCNNLRFVFDVSRQDYNILRFVSFLGVPKIEVYSLKERSWSVLDRVDLPKPLRSPSTSFVDDFNVLTTGIPSWLIKKRIVTFDLSTRSFHKTLLPDLDSNREILSVMTLSGSLAVITHGHPHVFDVWVLGEIGVKESWSKRFSIGPFRHDLTPIGFWGESGLVFEHDRCSTRCAWDKGREVENGQVFVYDFDEEKLKNIGSYDPTSNLVDRTNEVSVRVVNYKETLVSPRMSLKRKRKRK